MGLLRGLNKLIYVKLYVLAIIIIILKKFESVEKHDKVRAVLPQILYSFHLTEVQIHTGHTVYFCLSSFSFALNCGRMSINGRINPPM